LYNDGIQENDTLYEYRLNSADLPATNACLLQTTKDVSTLVLPASSRRTTTKMKSILIALIVAASATAFIPVDHRDVSKVPPLQAIAPENEVGVLPPVGFFEYVRRLRPTPG
jgi:hypothetical protein